jgi:hypothetical protein
MASKHEKIFVANLRPISKDKLNRGLQKLKTLSTPPTSSPYWKTLCHTTAKPGCAAGDTKILPIHLGRQSLLQQKRAIARQRTDLIALLVMISRNFANIAEQW